MINGRELAKDAPSGFDPCTDIPEQVLTEAKVGRETPDLTEAPGGVVWGCDWVYLGGGGYAMSVCMTNLTLDMVRDKNCPEATEYTIAGRAAMVWRQGTWHGDAATRYGIMRNEQNIPLETLPLVFEEIAVSLETVAKAELALYSELATKVAELESSVVAAVGDLSDLLDPPAAAANLANTVEAARVFIVNTITAMAESDATNIIESQKIQQNGGYQRGVPNNKWPPAVSETAAFGNGLDGLKNSMGDGTTADGDKSDWELGPAATVAQ